jgi:hypothetical protein
VALVALGLAGAALYSYRQPLVPLTRLQRGVLGGLRALTLVAVFLFACRPIVLRPPAVTGDVIVPVLVDASRSMRVPDADGQTRIAAARQLVESRLLPSLSRIGRVELFRIGEGLVESSAANLTADARRSDIAGGVTAARERFRGRRVAGVIVVSDGGDTAQGGSEAAGRAGAPVFAIGVGAATGVPDREVVGMTAGDPAPAEALARGGHSAGDVGPARVSREVRRGRFHEPFAYPEQLDVTDARQRREQPRFDQLPRRGDAGLSVGIGHAHAA